MRALITGLNGTLAPRLAEAAAARGIECIGWNRAAAPPEDEAAGLALLDGTSPDVLFHLATGSPAWAGQLARWAARHQRPLVFTSTAMVFDHVPDGPHRPGDARTARDDYGRGKIACEDAVLAAHSGAHVVRLGWQIDGRARGNNMLMQLDEWQARDGEVAASRQWTPACSFMDDTVRTLLGLLDRPRPGVVHVDANAVEAHRFDRIVRALQRHFHRDGWQLRVHDDYRHDQRLVEGDASMPALSRRLPALLETS